PAGLRTCRPAGGASPPATIRLKPSTSSSEHLLVTMSRSGGAFRCVSRPESAIAKQAACAAARSSSGLVCSASAAVRPASENGTPLRTRDGDDSSPLPRATLPDQLAVALLTILGIGAACYMSTPVGKVEDASGKRAGQRAGAGAGAASTLLGLAGARGRGVDVVADQRRRRPPHRRDDPDRHRRGNPRALV